MKQPEDLRVQSAREIGQATGGYGNLHLGDKNRICIREMVEDQTCESKVQRKEVKPQEASDHFQHGDKKTSVTKKRAEDLRVQDAGKEVKPITISSAGTRRTVAVRRSLQTTPVSPACRERRSSQRMAVTIFSMGTRTTSSA